MYCGKCGSQNNSEARFCVNCGEALNQLPNQTEQQNDQADTIHHELRSQNYDNFESKKVERLRKISKVIGIISIILVFIFQILTMPLSLVGLIFGLKYKKQANRQRNDIGIILNGISLIIAIPIYLVYSSWLLNPINPVAGTWNCGTLEDSTNYVFTLSLYTNKNFSYDKYGDAINNTIKGKIEIEDLQKTNASGSHKYYSLKLNSNETIVDGKALTNQVNMQFEMGVGTSLSEAKGSAVLMNTTNYNTYYCYIQK